MLSKKFKKQILEELKRISAELMDLRACIETNKVYRNQNNFLLNTIEQNTDEILRRLK